MACLIINRFFIGGNQMQSNMSLFINFFKQLFSSKSEENTQEVKPATIKRPLPSTPINTIADEGESSNTITDDLMDEKEKNKKSQTNSTKKSAVKLTTQPETKKQSKEPAKAKPIKKAKSVSKAQSKTSTKTIPTTIVLDDANSSLTIKNKRIVGHCSISPETFIVTHIVKPDQEKLRMNLALTGWQNVEGLSFVTYDIANDAIIFSKKSDNKMVAQLNDVLLAWARELNKNYYL